MEQYSRMWSKGHINVNAVILRFASSSFQTTKGKLLNVEARAELQRMEMLRIQKVSQRLNRL